MRWRLPWYDEFVLPAAPLPQQKPQVAYFCAEFGLAEDLPFYAGGLGILAGDTLKQAADEDFPLVGIGLFYHGKRDRQIVDPDGWQRYENYHFDPRSQQFYEVRLPGGQPWKCVLPLGGETVAVYALARTLSPNVTVYFLETDREDNPWHMRDLTLAPYWGDERQQLRQQFVLGCAGVRLLTDLNLVPETFHLNEGRPALLVWELAAWLKENRGLSTADALRQARRMMVYTNHTLVRAGNVSYPLPLVQEHVQPWADRLGAPVGALLAPGVAPHTDRFEVTEFGLQMSRLASGVSERHTKLCQKQWPEFSWVNITNGVHFPTWKRPGFSAGRSLTDQELWREHQQAKQDLVTEAQERTGIGYDPERLVLGWARRITDYKRLDSLFVDLDRLERILRSADRPVQLVVAGKAHPGNEHAIRLLQHVIQIFQKELSGMALFIPDYDIGLSRRLTAGVDVWLNTPVDGREACGTSGMKAAANGVLQATVADGWAAEVDWNGAGWVLDPAEPGRHLLSLLEEEITPLFWQRENGVPTAWIQRLRRTMELVNHFSAQRMLAEYREKLYTSVA